MLTPPRIVSRTDVDRTTQSLAGPPRAAPAPTQTPPARQATPRSRPSTPLAQAAQPATQQDDPTLVQFLFQTITNLQNEIAAMRVAQAELLARFDRGNEQTAAQRMPPPPPGQRSRRAHRSGAGGRDVPGYDALDEEPARAAAQGRQEHHREDHRGGRLEDSPEDSPAAESEEGQRGREYNWAEVARGRRRGANRPGPGQPPAPDRRSPEQRKKDAVKAGRDILMEHPPQPIEFVNITFTVPNPRPLLEANGGGAKVQVVREMLTRLGAKRFVSGITVAPNPGNGGPIVHLVIPRGAEPALDDIFSRTKLLRIDSATCIPIGQPPRTRQTPDEARKFTARRLAFLCAQSRSRNFQETALLGVPEDLRKETLEAYRVLVSDQRALLGHVDRPYSTGMEEVV